MEFSYYEFNGKFIDFQVVETSFWFTWIRLKYELYDDNGNVKSVLLFIVKLFIFTPQNSIPMQLCFIYY